jgi:hypothetical protein
VSLAPQYSLLLLLGIWVVVYLLVKPLHLERRGIEMKPLWLTIRTKRFNDLMVRVATRHPTFWRWFGNLSIAAAIVEIALAVYTLGNNLYNFVNAPQSATPVVPIVPGITISFSWFPYILVAIGIAVTIHEASHGIVASVEKIQIKSSGIILAPITFGAFVEPNEEDFEKARLSSKLRVLASGSFMNALAGILAILLLLSLFGSVSGVLVASVEVGGPAAKAGMSDWDVIYAIDGHPTPDYPTMQVFLAAMRPGDRVAVDTSRGRLDIDSVSNPQNSSIIFLGIRSYTSYRYVPLRAGEFSTRFTYNLRLTIEWVQLIMINLAIFNMLPLYPLDGEGFVSNIIIGRLKHGSRIVRIALNIFSLSLLGSNMVLSFLRYGITPI